MSRLDPPTASGLTVSPASPSGGSPSVESDAVGDAIAPVAFSVEGLSVVARSRSGPVTLVDDVSFSVRRGETMSLVGESGSGKSVTSLAALGLLPRSVQLTKGQVYLGSTELTGLTQAELSGIRGKRVSMIFQEPMTSLNPALTVGRQISEVARRHLGVSRREATKMVVEVLDNVRIPFARSRLGAYPHEFSGGMRQRVMIAMALVCRPEVIIADEPTTALDVTIQAQVLELLRSLRDEMGLALIFITHDLGVVADIADRVTVMYAGHILETAAVDQLFTQPNHPYTEGLLRSMPTATGRRERLISIPGQPPTPGSVLNGCRFAPRCPYAEPACLDAEPRLQMVADAGESRCRRIDELTLKGVA